MNQIEKLMSPVIMAIKRKDLYRKRSIYVTSLSFLQISCKAIVFLTYIKSKAGLPFILAILLKDSRKRVVFDRSVNSGVSSTNKKKAAPETTLGMSMKKAILYFQLSTKQESREISEIPKEKASWIPIIILYLVLPATSSLKKLQCTFMAPFEPKPSRKAPNPTITTLPEQIVTICPIIQIVQAISSAFFLPQLSATCDMMRYPRSDPIQQIDCRKDDIQAFQQVIMMPQSKAIEALSGFFKCQSQKLQLLQLHTNQAHVLQSAISRGLHSNSGTQQKKFKLKSIIAATIHLSANMPNRRYWYLPQPPTRFSRLSTVFYYQYIIFLVQRVIVNHMITEMLVFQPYSSMQRSIFIYLYIIFTIYLSQSAFGVISNLGQDRDL